MRRNLFSLVKNVGLSSTFQFHGTLRCQVYLARRSRVSDCFNEVYRWKNARNRPANEILDQDSAKPEVQQANLTLQTVHHLERLSLVDFDNEAAIARLSSAIRFADRLKDIDTSSVEPLFSLLENESLVLRNDEVTECNLKTDVLRNASVTFEDFFVAPPGNIPLEQQKVYDGVLKEEKTSGGIKANESAADLKKARRKVK